MPLGKSIVLHLFADQAVEQEVAATIVIFASMVVALGEKICSIKLFVVGSIMTLLLIVSHQI